MEEQQRRSVWYQCLVIFLTIFTLAFLIFTVILNFFGQSTGFIGSVTLFPDWFSGDIGEITDKFYLDATPAGWAFSIWAVIFLFQLGWVIYVLTTLCRRHQSGPVFLNPPVVSPFFLWMYCLNLGFNCAWLFLYDNEWLVWAYVDILLVWITALIPFVTNLRAVDRYGVELRQNLKDFRAIRILIQNGLAIYLAWITVAAILNMGMVMSYVGEVPQETTSTVILSLLGFIVVGYFLLETLVFEKYLRYIYSFWAVAVWALAGIWAKTCCDLEDRNTLITLILLLLSVVLGLGKIVLSVVCTISKPLYRTEYVNEEQRKHIK